MTDPTVEIRNAVAVAWRETSWAPQVGEKGIGYGEAARLRRGAVKDTLADSGFLCCGDGFRVSSRTRACAELPDVEYLATDTDRAARVPDFPPASQVQGDLKASFIRYRSAGSNSITRPARMGASPCTFGSRRRNVRSET